FALKGGTAINLFVRDMPRLSADIDLTYLPVAGRAASLKGALCRYPLCLPRPRTSVDIRAPDTESDKPRRDNELTDMTLTTYVLYVILVKSDMHRWPT
ncbi:MAG TPA: nucleotidyl transferase AbiEii/AbiGii toxin family protein, partial [Chthoniobacterales bacterium]